MRIIKRNSVEAVMAEKRILEELSHPLIISMDFAFQDQKHLYMLMKSYAGGDLRMHLARRKKFTEQQTKFFAACVISALGYIHKKNIIHRDLKPENLVFDCEGYLHLTDFGVAKYWRANNSANTSGTPGYMAPEVLARTNHSFSVDYYALGVVVYECATGSRPYEGKTRKDIESQIMAKQAALTNEAVSGGWSSSGLDFCNKLVQRKREHRLGEKGIEDLKSHPWFRNFDWKKLDDKSLKAPYIPNIDLVSYDRRSSLKADDKFDAKDLRMLREKDVQELFRGYEYNSCKTIHLDNSPLLKLQPEEFARKDTCDT